MLNLNFSPALQILNDAINTHTPLSTEEMQLIRDEMRDVREAATGVLTWRQGNLPALGFIRDNDVSRRAVKMLALAVGWDEE